MKNKKLLSLLLLTGLLASCGTTFEGSSSESSSEQTTSESESESQHSGSGSDSSHDHSSSEVSPCEDGHTLTHYLGQEATCTEDGYLECWFCSECQELFFTKPKGEVTEANAPLDSDHRAHIHAEGHKYGEYIHEKDASCTENGLEVRTCEVCGYEDKKVLPLTGHNYGDVDYLWDFDNMKLTATMHCDNGTGHDKEETVDIIKASTVAGTCTSTGYIKYRSYNFTTDKKFERQEYIKVTPIKHKLEYVPAEESYCVADSHGHFGHTAYYKCNGGCGKYFADENATRQIEVDSWYTLDRDANNHVSIVNVKARVATCSQIGWNAHQECEACGTKINYVPINTLPHTADTKSWASDKDYHYRLCKDCGAMMYADTKVAHTEGDPDEHGDVHCSVCGYLMSAGSGHVHTYDYVPQVDATCLATGVAEHYECQCGKVFDSINKEEITDPDTLIIPIADHNYKDYAAKAPNCTLSGNNAYAQCTVCNKYFNAGHTAEVDYENDIYLPALNHSFTIWTYDETSHWHICDNCPAIDGKDPHTPVTPEYIADPDNYEGEVFCECGYQIRGEVHYCRNHLSVHNDVDPTCTTPGNSKYYECTECGNYYSDANATNQIMENSWILLPTGHDHANHIEGVAATCTSTGTKDYYVCSKDGGREIYVDKHFEIITDDSQLVIPVDANNHASLTYHPANAATCTVDGNTAYYSCACGKYFSDAEAQHEIAENSWIVEHEGHQYNPATWSFDNTNHWNPCDNCDDHLNAAAHVHAQASDYDNPELDILCDVCGYNMRPGTEHTHNMVEHAATAATCTTNGNTLYYECSICHNFYSDAEGANKIAENSWVIASPGHSYGEWSQTTAPTCTTAGEETRECSVCHNVEHREVAALGHSLEHEEAHAATCAAAGNLEYWHCTRCGGYYKDAQAKTPTTQEATVVAKLTTHQGLGDWEVTTAPTCTAVGEESRECSVCHEVEHREVAALGHNLKGYDAKDPDCTNDGNTAYWQCTRCNKYFADSEGNVEKTWDQIKINNLGGHEWVIDTSVQQNGFKFINNGTQAEVYLKCTKTDGHVHADTIIIATAITHTDAETCETDRVVTYTATYLGASESKAYTIEGTHTDHSWVYDDPADGGKGIVFTEDNKSATIYYHCEHDSAHEDHRTCVVDGGVPTLEPTCENTGITTYTATITAENSLDGQAHEGTKAKVTDKLGHIWHFDGIEFDDDGKYAHASYHCTRESCDDTEVLDVKCGSATLIEPTCDEDPMDEKAGWGTTRYTATFASNIALDGVQRVETIDIKDIRRLEHTYYTTYKWTSGTTEVKKVDTCQRDTDHVVISTSSDVATATTFSQNERLSPIGKEPGTTGYHWSGDLNLEFSNTNLDSSKGRSFETTFTIRITNASALSSMDCFIVKVDNAHQVDDDHSGGSAVVVYSNLSHNNKNNKFTNVAGYDSRTNTYSRDGITSSSDSTLYNAFKQFMMDCDVVVHVKFDASDKSMLIEITYNTNVAGYESYRGYKQTVTATMHNDDFSWNVANCVKFARRNTSTTMEVKSIEYTPNLYNDIFLSKCESDSKSGVWGYQYYKTIDTQLIDVADV